MIRVHEDTDTDGDVDANDLWHHHAYDELWRMVATYREDDSDPKEEFLHHDAGLDGMGASSYINGLVCRDKDANTAWTAQSDGVLEERLYYCQNWRGDVVALVHKARKQVESVRYSSYGVPLGIPEPDTNSDMSRDAADLTQFDTWISTGHYDVRGDTELDGDVDTTDKNLAIAYGAQTLGWTNLSWVSNARGFAGYRQFTLDLWFARSRTLSERLGRWLSRDPLGYTESRIRLYQYVDANPLASVDPFGLSACPGTPVGPGVGCGIYGEVRACTFLVCSGLLCTRACWKLRCLCEATGNYDYQNCQRGCEQALFPLAPFISNALVPGTLTPGLVHNAAISAACCEGKYGIDLLDPAIIALAFLRCLEVETKPNKN